MKKTNHVPVIASVVVAVVFGYSINSWFSTNLSAFAVDRVAAQRQIPLTLLFPGLRTGICREISTVREFVVDG